MEITKHEIPISKITDLYSNSELDGVWGLGRKLNIRPAFQREFIYGEEQQQAVIESIMKGFPIGVMYWSVNTDEDGNETYEVIDGQQRLTSIGDYVKGKYSLNNKKFSSLSSEAQKQINDYTILVYYCSGTSDEKLEWFETINIAGMKLEDQELRNAAYPGTWLTDAKRKFKSGGSAYQLSKKYVGATEKTWKRWAGLELAIIWICGSNKDDDIRSYMDEHMADEDAQELLDHWIEVINWVTSVFERGKDGKAIPSKLLKRRDWWQLYNQYHENTYDPEKVIDTVYNLFQNDEIGNANGIIPYVLDPNDINNIAKLDLRLFSDEDKLAKYAEQDCKCAICEKEFSYEAMRGDHIIPWSKGGKTEIGNCQMLCVPCNTRKTDNQLLSKEDLAKMGIHIKELPDKKE